MHLNYICIVITYLRPYKQLISSLWIGIMLLSIALIVLHRHDHSQGSVSCATETKHEHQHQQSEDCHYCFLFFQQGIQTVKAFTWESSPTEIQLTRVINSREFKFPILNPKTSKSLRAPPLAIII